MASLLLSCILRRTALLKAPYRLAAQQEITLYGHTTSHTVFRQWGNPLTTDQAKEFTIALPLAARVYVIMLTDTSSAPYQAIDVSMCWDKDNLEQIISTFRVKATFPPSTFNWLFIGRLN